MRKLMALCLSLLMVLSMCSFTAFAEENEAVLFEDILNGQLQNFIVGDLAIPTGATVTSSNPVVISETGKVTRPLFEDEKVTLTVNGTSFEVIVKAQTVSSYTEAVTFEGAAADTSLLGTTGWSAALSAETANGSANVLANGTNNYASITPVKEYEECVYTFQTIPSAANAKYITLEFDLAYLSTSASFNHIFYINGSKAGTIVANGANNYSYDLSTANPWYSDIRTPYTAGGIGADNFKRVVMKVDVDERTVSFSMGGVAFASYDLQTSSIDLTNISSIKFATRSRYNKEAANSVLVDNMIAYVTTDEATALSNATAADRSVYYSKYLEEAYVANGGNLGAVTSDLKFEADEELPADVSITWKSSDEAVIAADGTVTRPFFVEQTVTITGTVKVDGADDIVKTYTAKVLPLRILGQSEIVDFDTAGSVEDFKLDSKTTSSAVNEAGNNVGAFTFTGTNTITLASYYSFDKLPSIANAKELIMSFKLRTQNHSEEGTENVTNYGFRVNGSEIAEFINYGGCIRVNNTYNGADATNGWHGSNPANVNYNTNSNNYAEFKIIVDLAEKTAKHYLNDTPIGAASVGIGLASLDSITSMDFYISDRVSGSTVYVDDIYVHTTQSLDSAVSTLSDADKVSFFKELIGTTEFADVTAGQTLALDSTYASYDLDELGVSITWESNNDAYISNNGQVKKLAEFGTNVTVDMTATITAGTESDTSTIEVEIDDSTELVKTVDFTDTTMNIGSKATYVTDDVVHGNVIYMEHTQDEINENEKIWLENGQKGANPYDKTSSTIAAVSGGGRGDRLVVEADVKYVHGDAEGAFGALGVTTFAGKKGMQVGLNYKTGNVTLQTTATTVDPSARSLLVSDKKTVTFPMPESVLQKGEGEWVHITIDHNALSQTYSVYIDGQLVNEVPVLQAQMALVDSIHGLSIPGSAIRGISIELSQTGEMWVDNVSLKKYSNTDAVEVNAALNAALVEYASKEYRTVLTNRDLAPMTIGKSWINDNKYDRDIIVTQTDTWGAKYKVENPSTYKFVEDGPALTYEINGEVVNAINVDHAGIVNLTITAKANGIEESKTVERKVAPVAIRGLALGTADCLNGLWLEGATGNEKVVVVQCLENGAPDYSYTPATDEEEAYEWFGTQVFDLAAIINSEEYESYNPETGIMKGISGVTHPRDSETIEKVKIFVFGENGIAPVAHKEIILE